MSLRSRLLFPLLLLAVAAVCVRLGLWQVHRLQQRREANRSAVLAERLPEVDLDTIEPGIAAHLAYRRVRANGTYDRTGELALRGMTYAGTPGIHLVTPLRFPDGAGVLVKRGFVPAPDAVTVDVATLSEPGTVEVRGIALAIDSAPDRGAPLTRGATTTWARLDRVGIRGRTTYPVLPIFVLQTPGPGLGSIPRRLDAPTFDDGPHLSYAIQWFSFATTALVMAAIFAFRSRERPSDHPAAR